MREGRSETRAYVALVTKIARDLQPSNYQQHVTDNQCVTEIINIAWTTNGTRISRQITWLFSISLNVLMNGNTIMTIQILQEFRTKRVRVENKQKNAHLLP